MEKKTSKNKQPNKKKRTNQPKKKKKNVESRKQWSFLHINKTFLWISRGRPTERTEVLVWEPCKQPLDDLKKYCVQRVTRASALCWVCHMTHNGDQPLVCTFFCHCKAGRNDNTQWIARTHTVVIKQKNLFETLSWSKLSQFSPCNTEKDNLDLRHLVDLSF